MFDLNDAVDSWLAKAVETEPGLGVYVDEIADHVVSASEANIASGMAPADAFAAAIEALGEPTMLAGEFRKDGGIAATLRRLACNERAPSKREQVAMASAWILMSLFWAGVMIVVQGSSTWATFAWIVTTYLPLTAIGAMMSRREPKTKAA